MKKVLLALSILSTSFAAKADFKISTQKVIDYTVYDETIRLPSAGTPESDKREVFYWTTGSVHHLKTGKLVNIKTQVIYNCSTNTAKIAYEIQTGGVGFYWRPEEWFEPSSAERKGGEYACNIAYPK